MRGLPSRYRSFVSWCVSILWLSLPSAALPASTAFGVNVTSSNFASFDLTTPDTITAITPYANFTWAGDFWIDGVMYQINASTNNLESVTADGIITIIGPSIPPGPETWTGMATDPTTETMYAGVQSTDVGADRN